jgi:hypothetical protein
MGKRNPPPFGRPLELPGALGTLARAVGGTGKLSECVGVTTRTLQRWAKTVPPKRARMLLERLAREHRLPRTVQHELANFNL